MPDINITISITDAVRLSSISDCVVDSLGFSQADFLTGQVTLAQLIHADDQDIADRLFSKTLTSSDFNFRLRQANGRIRCFKGHFSKISEPASGGVILELLLQDAKSLAPPEISIMPNFKAMMENTDDYIYFKDRNHVFTGASQTLVEITDPSEHWTDLLGQTDYDVFPEEYADVYYRLEKQVFAGEHVAHEIQETLDNEGNTGWVDNRKYPMYGKNGEIVGLFGIARDITVSYQNQQKIEHLLEEQKARLDILRIAATAFETQEGISITDHDGNVLRVNNAFTTITGYSAEEVIGKNLRILKSDHHPAEFYSAMWQALISEGKWAGEIWNKRKNGEVYPEFRTVTAVKNEAGEITHYVASFTDITERVRLQEELKNRADNDFLTGLNNRRHFLELAEAELIRSRRYNNALSMVMMDIDFFKKINDSYGHKAGDNVLQKLALVCEEHLREVDIIGRLGGEEFVILLPETDAVHAIEVAERLRLALADVSVDSEHADTALRFTVSMGIAAMLSPKETVDDLLQKADEALYQAKNTGRNKVVLCGIAKAALA